jgi:hypothetical protein
MAQRVKASAEESTDGRSGDDCHAKKIQKTADPKLLLATRSPESRS